jgi:hypothetical protein
MKTLRATRFSIRCGTSACRGVPYFFASLKVAVTLAFRRLGDFETVASTRQASAT